MYRAATNCGGAADTEANLSLMGFFRGGIVNPHNYFSVMLYFSLAY